MPRIKYSCSKCNAIKNVSFVLGTPAEVPICEECNIPMSRGFAKTDLGEIETDEMTNIRLMMKNSQSYTGKDRIAY